MKEKKSKASKLSPKIKIAVAKKINVVKKPTKKADPWKPLLDDVKKSNIAPQEDVRKSNIHESQDIPQPCVKVEKKSIVERFFDWIGAK